MKIERKELDNGGVLTMVKTDRLKFYKGQVVLVTDPCYWFDEEDKEKGFDLWQILCGMMFPDNWSTLPEDDKLYKYCVVKYTHPDGTETEFLFTSTAHGDGSYTVMHQSGTTKRISGSTTSVDAGCFAVVLLDSAKRFDKYDSNLETAHGTVLQFEKDAEVIVDGESMSGAIECDTDWNDYEDDTCGICGKDYEYCD